MTKKEREALQGFMNKIGGLKKERDRIFEELQISNNNNNGRAWCSAEMNAKELGNEWAEDMLRKYNDIGAQIELLQEYGTMLASIDFWK